MSISNSFDNAGIFAQGRILEDRIGYNPKYRNVTIGFSFKNSYEFTVDTTRPQNKELIAKLDSLKVFDEVVVRTSVPRALPGYKDEKVPFLAWLITDIELVPESDGHSPSLLND